MVLVKPTASEDAADLLDAWATCLGTAQPTFKEQPSDWFWDLRLQLDFLRENIAAIEAACEPERTAATLRCLEGARRTIQLSSDTPRR